MLILLFGMTAVYDVLFFFLIDVFKSDWGVANFIEVLNNTMNTSQFVNETG